MKKFDRHRPHGTVYGVSEARWEQDGEQFRPDGTWIDFEAQKAQATDEVTEGMDAAQKALDKARRSQAIKEGIRKAKEA